MSLKPIYFLGHLLKESFPTVSPERSLHEKLVQFVFKLSVSPFLLMTSYHLAIATQDKEFGRHFTEIGKQLDQMSLIAGVAIFAMSGIGLLGQYGFGKLISKITRFFDPKPWLLELIGCLLSTTIFTVLPSTHPFFYVSGLVNVGWMICKAYKSYSPKSIPS